MSEIRRDEIVYEEGWRDRKAEKAEENLPLAEDNPADPKPSEPVDDTDRSRPLLIAIQLVLCMLAALVLFILKAMDSGAYHDFMDTYTEEMAKPVISQKVFDAVDWNRILRGDSVKITSTSDELSTR
ncbi:MAG: hypothetical protein IJS27_02475 [Ruminococcus sp.]|nr:hypothetical protein [Ruminococcus sp.]